MNAHDASFSKRRRPAHAQLEEQLEGVLDQDDGSVIRFSRISRSIPGLPGSAFDIEMVRQQKGQQSRKKRVLLEVQRGPHEASEHVIRLDGVAAKPVKERRDPFHLTMHRWQTPLQDQGQVASVLVRASDLWVDQIDPEYLAAQFTPGDPAEALRESTRGLWTRLRQPFIRWSPAKNIRKSSKAEISALNETVISTMNDASEDGAFDDRIETAPVGIEPAVTERGSRWSQWRASFGETIRAAHEREQETLQEVEEAWEAPYVRVAVRPGRIAIAFFGLLCLVAMPAGAVSWSRSLSQTVAETKVAAEGVLRVPANVQELDSWSRQMAALETITKQLERTHGLAFSVAQLIPSTRSTAKTTRALLTAAQEGAEAARLMSLGVARLSDGDVATPDERLVRFQKYVREAKPHVDRLYVAAHQIEPEALPEQLQEQVRTIQQALFDIEPVLSSSDRLADLLLSLVGHEHARTYLVLFQNTAELRPSGGFMGSYAEVALDRGALRSVRVPGGGPYDLRNQLRARWRPPEPLTLVGERWEFQDANWAPDFASTAALVGEFWSKAGQPTIDGIFAVNSSLLPKLLELTGPIEMPAYGKRITAENVLFETQKAVELEYDREANTPKAFVGDLNNEVLQRLQALDPARWPDVALMLAKALETKDIQLWFSRADEQAAARSFGWTGEWAEPGAFATLGVVGANIAGQKSDAVIREQVYQRVKIDASGTVEERVLLAREHTGVAEQLFHGANNVQYLRMYMPLGSTLLGAEGFEPPATSLFEVPTEKEVPFPGLALTKKTDMATGVSVDLSEEGGRSVVGGWIQLRPGMSRETAFTYRLARTTEDMAKALLEGVEQQAATDAYVLRLQSQSGAPRQHRLEIVYPKGWEVVQLSPGMKQTAPGTLVWDQSVLDQDHTIIALFSRYASSNNVSSNP